MDKISMGDTIDAARDLLAQHGASEKELEYLDEIKAAANREKRGGRYSIIPAKAVDDPNLSLGSLRILSVIGTYSDPEGWCYPSLATMAKRINTSKSYVSKCVKELVLLGYLETVHRFRKNGSQRSSLYRIILENRKLDGGVNRGVNQGKPGSYPLGLTGELTLERPTLNDPQERMRSAILLKNLLKENPKLASYLETNGNPDCNSCQGIGVFFIPENGTGRWLACECAEVEAKK